MEEKRKTPRFKCVGPNVCLIEFPGMEEVGRMTNISRGGIGFRVSRQLRKDASYSFDIRPGGRVNPIPCRARVVWVNTDEATHSCYCGARIEEIDAADKVMLIDEFYEEWKRQQLSQLKSAEQV